MSEHRSWQGMTADNHFRVLLMMNVCHALGLQAPLAGVSGIGWPVSVFVSSIG
jgi:hypothetical protein